MNYHIKSTLNELLASEEWVETWSMQHSSATLPSQSTAVGSTENSWMSRKAGKSLQAGMGKDMEIKRKEHRTSSHEHRNLSAFSDMLSHDLTK